MRAFPMKSSFESSRPARDRKSTRLNSSHSSISYAVFCLKKKKKKKKHDKHNKKKKYIDTKQINLFRVIRHCVVVDSCRIGLYVEYMSVRYRTVHNAATR